MSQSQEDRDIMNNLKKNDFSSAAHKEKLWKELNNARLLEDDELDAAAGGTGASDEITNKIDRLNNKGRGEMD